MPSASARSLRICVLLLVAIFRARAASPASVAIGILSYDDFIPGATSTFGIQNFTGDPLLGGYALSPDFPVVTSLLFSGAELTLTEEGGAVTVLPLGDIAPGPLLDPSGDPLPSLQIPSAIRFLSARLTASFAAPLFLLDDGRTFTPSVAAFTAMLLPGAIGVLATGDLTIIEIDGTFADVPVATVPEPTSAILLLSGIALAARRRRALQGPPDRR